MFRFTHPVYRLAAGALAALALGASWGTTQTAPTGGTYNMQFAHAKYCLGQQNW